MNWGIVAMVTKVAFREFWRSPEAVFWTYGFPLLMTVVLGFAFQPSDPTPIPIAVVLPLRSLFFRRSSLWQCAAAGFLAWMVPKVGSFLAIAAGQPTDGVASASFVDVAVAMLMVPVLARLLRVVPPLSLFMERGE